MKFPTSDAWGMVAVCLYSTGHWIGGTFALVGAFLTSSALEAKHD